jgi:hypothetical protein
MPGLVPGIHVLKRRQKERRGWRRTGGRSRPSSTGFCPAMTNSALFEIAIRLSLSYHLAAIGVERIVDDPLGSVELVIIRIAEMAESLGVLVDELLDEPRASDPVDLHALAGDPFHVCAPDLRQVQPLCSCDASRRAFNPCLLKACS